ncbi:Tubulin-specific chaperone A [Hypsizygus marmoreus]|uniref:Tubulin-specific chaperone A n=1 Tax=Hypsizygus marmoreus TaxID=39966 RepID=A0A369KAG8_HYPMA|nr:Tubulin-specific chaperone A [Hypsizygus marmoreus]
MSDIPAARRQLKIKAGVVKRLSKEHTLYRKEAEQQQQKLNKFIAAGAEGWDINNGTRMMEEANRMITDSANRLGKAAGELRDLVVAAKKEPKLAEDEELLKAEEVLEETSA